MIFIGGCYGVNERTSEIGSLNTECLGKNAWTEIGRRHSTAGLTDSLFVEAIEELKRQPFKTEVLFFESSPKELIAVSDDHYSVRYVFNPAISDQVLDGLSAPLSPAEKKRIRNRVQELLMDYQCEEGKRKSQELMKTEP